MSDSTPEDNDGTKDDEVDPSLELRRSRLDRSTATLDAEESLLVTRREQLDKLREQIERTQTEQRAELARIEEGRRQLNDLAADVERRRYEVDDFRAQLIEAETDLSNRRDAAAGQDVTVGEAALSGGASSMKKAVAVGWNGCHDRVTCGLWP